MPYKRKTRDVFDIEGFYLGATWVWECVTSEETRREALKRLREYRENEPGTSFRIRKTREPIVGAV